MSEDETIKVQGQPISKLQKCRKMNFVEFDRIFVIEVSYESPENNKQDGTKFMSVIQHFHVEKLTFLKTVIFRLFDLLTSVLNILTCSIPHLKLPNITYRMVYSLLRCE